MLIKSVILKYFTSDVLETDVNLLLQCGFSCVNKHWSLSHVTKGWTSEFILEH